MLVMVAVCVRLGVWQFHRAHPAAVVTGTAVALDSVVKPGQAPLTSAVGRPVTVTGRYLPQHNLVVVDRPASGSTSTSHPQLGVWALSALRTSSGTILPVVRGWAPSAALIAPPPSGAQHVRGILQPSESPAPVQPTTPLAAGEIGLISAASLAGRYETANLYDAYLVLTPPTAGMHAVDAAVQPARGWHVLNTGYALQWWVFAGFIVFMWTRMLREDAA